MYASDSWVKEAVVHKDLQRLTGKFAWIRDDVLTISRGAIELMDSIQKQLIGCRLECFKYYCITKVVTKPKGLAWIW